MDLRCEGPSQEGMVGEEARGRVHSETEHGSKSVSTGGKGEEKFTLVDVKLFWEGWLIPCHLTTLYLLETIVDTK
jgi:hypothetical protein